jgi:predicted small integral membrane protein
MLTEISIWEMLKALLALGFALWTSVGALNNFIGFRTAGAALARTMAMQPLRDPPVIELPFAARALTSPNWAKAALICILIIQVFAALALGSGGGVLLLGAVLGEAAAPRGIEAALIGFALLSLLWLGMMIAGLWFGYWIRQEGLQLTHIALLAVTILAAMVIHG